MKLNLFIPTLILVVLLNNLYAQNYLDAVLEMNDGSYKEGFVKTSLGSDDETIKFKYEEEDKPITINSSDIKYLTFGDEENDGFTLRYMKKKRPKWKSNGKKVKIYSTPFWLNVIRKCDEFEMYHSFLSLNVSRSNKVYLRYYKDESRLLLKRKNENEATIVVYWLNVANRNGQVKLGPRNAKRYLSNYFVDEPSIVKEIKNTKIISINFVKKFVDEKCKNE